MVDAYAYPGSHLGNFLLRLRILRSILYNGFFQEVIPAAFDA